MEDFPLPLPWRVGEYTFDELATTTGMSWLLKGRDARGVEVMGKVPMERLGQQLIRDEAEMMRTLSGSQYFLTYREYTRQQGLVILIWNFQRGESFFQRRKRIGRFGLLHALRAGRESCRALEVVSSLRHPKGGLLNVVHRDIKPANIIWTDKGRIVLIDFGIATWRGRWSPESWRTTRTLVGSPSYLAPEQTGGVEMDDLDLRTDIFSLGIVLWELVMGRRFYSADTVSGVVMLACRVGGYAERIAEIEAVCPDLARVLGGCLQRDPDDRFRHPQRLREALQKVRIPAR